LTLKQGSDDTFKEFPGDLQRLVAKELPDNRVESVVYPKYDTKGELHQATGAFVEWYDITYLSPRFDDTYFEY
jgi:hypothetical protein